MRLRLGPWTLSLGRPEAAPVSAAPAASPAAPAPSPLAVIQGLAEGLLAVDRGRRVWLANDALSPLLNRPPHQAVGRLLWEVLRQREVNDMAEAALGGAIETREITVPVPAETFWQVHARPLPEGAVLSFVDLTRLRRLEAMRKDFVANVSHELKTPLTSLRASLETLLDGAVDDPAHAREFLSTAQAQAERLQRLIEDLLVLSRLDRPDQPTPPGRAAFAAVARQVEASIKPLAEKAEVAVAVAAPAADVALSEEELTQVLTNLLDNAIKFNRPGGRAELEAATADGALRVTVRDTGIGIPPQDQPRIFERFYRVDKARGRDVGGTGLGLAIVKNIVERRRGTIHLESMPGQGSVFTVILPLAS